MANIIRSQHHVLHQALWDANLPMHLPSILKPPEDVVVRHHTAETDACRMFGTLHLKKVAGNIHILYGKPLDGIDGLHIHIAPLFGQAVLNFSHRIDHFSFGTPRYNQIHPLEALEVISDHPSQSFSYFLNMVPIRVNNQYGQLDTYQYAMTMKDRLMNHSTGSHAIPGIFFHYDTFPLRIKVEQTRELLGTFLARLAALVGGLFSTVGFLRQMVIEFPELVLDSRVGRRWRTAWTQRKIEFKRKLAEKLPSGLDKVDTTTPVLDPDSET